MQFRAAIELKTRHMLVRAQGRGSGVQVLTTIGAAGVGTHNHERSYLTPRTMLSQMGYRYGGGNSGVGDTAYKGPNPPHMIPLCIAKVYLDGVKDTQGSDKNTQGEELTASPWRMIRTFCFPPRTFSP